MTMMVVEEKRYVDDDLDIMIGGTTEDRIDDLTTDNRLRYH